MTDDSKKRAGSFTAAKEGWLTTDRQLSESIGVGHGRRDHAVQVPELEIGRRLAIAAQTRNRHLALAVEPA